VAVLTASIAAIGLAVPATGAGATSLTYSTKPLIEFVSSGVPGNPFWGAVETGAEQAAKDQKVSFEYLAPQSSSDQIIEEEQLLKAAISRHPAGIAVNDQFPAALDPLVKQAVKAGVAIDIVNAGLSSWKADGAIDFIGQDDYNGGLAAGVAMAKAGVKVGACTYDPVEAGPAQRCIGFATAMKAAGRKEMNIDLNQQELTDPSYVASGLEAFLKANPSVDGLVVIGTVFYDPAELALKALNLQSKVKIGTFDTSTETLQAVEQGKLLFCIDQQPYLQGYYAVLALAQDVRYGLLPGSVLATGPNLITKANAAQVLKYNALGVRGA